MARDLNDRVTISFRCPERLRAKIEEAAERDGLNLTQEMTKCIEFSLSEDQRQIANSPLIKMQVEVIRQCEVITGKRWYEDSVTAQRVKNAMIGALGLLIPFKTLDVLIAWGADNETDDLLASVGATLKSLEGLRGPEVDRVYEGISLFIAKLRTLLEAQKDRSKATQSSDGS